jgi:DNA-directed RNA polymerase subunit RPC12/RpoP
MSTECVRCKAEIKEYSTVVALAIYQIGGRQERTYRLLECPACGHVEMASLASKLLEGLAVAKRPTE